MGLTCSPSGACDSINQQWWSYAPTASPTPAPTSPPTSAPTDNPTPAPTDTPTVDPTSDPTIDPTNDPTTDPTFDPTADPTIDPTADPTSDPTIDPSRDPTIDPTMDPTTDPTSDPTVSPTTGIPTLSPTTCYDLNGASTNDGYTIPIDQQVSELSFKHEVTDISKISVFIEAGESIEIPINLTNDDIQQLSCSGFGACVGSTIIARNNSVCNIICDEYLSCLDTIIRIEECETTQIICNGKKACSSTQIHIDSDNNDELSIDCGIESSCEDLYVNISGNSIINITCYDSNACDGMEVDTTMAITKDATVYKNIKLTMNSYSENVFFFNGFGYEEIDGSQQYVTCNIQDQYMGYPTNPSNPSSEILTTSVKNSYQGQKLPCDGVQIGCFQPNSSDTSSCFIQYSINSRDFTLSSPDPSALCYWVPISEITEISCSGACASSPTDSPTPAPTDAPSAPTELPTSDPTKDPTTDPTKDPTSDPTMDPTFDPTFDPTADPSRSPTADPTIDPTVNPTTDPSISPSTEPTIDPTSAPSISPSAAPTAPPTGSPTTPPSAAPTRFPTRDVDEIYDIKIDVTYSCTKLTRINKELIARNTSEFVATFEQIIEFFYFNEDSGLRYKDFMVQLLYINGKIVNSVRTRRMLLSDTELTLYDLDPDDINRLPINFTTVIETSSGKEDVITSATKGGEFKNGVQESLRQYFNNSNIIFDVATSNEALVAESKFATPVPEEQEDLTVLYLSIVIVSCGLLASAAAFIYNNLKSTAVDNAKYFTPFLITLAVYDFISDINLSLQIYGNDESAISMTNIYFLLGSASILFIVLPFIINLWYAMRINSQETIQNSPSARAGFGNHLPQFILLCIASAGTYPALTLTSSRIFALEFFNAGLLSSELHELSKIKIRSTIYGENVPQLLIQIIYSYVINKLENATILAFIASLLSIIASLVVYYAQKEQSEKFITWRYFLKLEANQMIDTESQAKITANKGLKNKLRDALCKVYGISNKSIEIGYVTLNDRGCRIHLQHSIFKSEMNRIKKKMLEGDNNDTLRGYRVEITEDMYIKQVIKSKKAEILDGILKHFKLSNHDEMQYRIMYQAGDEYDEEGSDDNLVTPKSKLHNYDNINGRTNVGLEFEYKETMDGVEMVEVETNVATKGRDVNIMALVENIENEMTKLRQMIKSDANMNEEDGLYAEPMKSTAI